MPRDLDRHCCDGRCVSGHGCPAFAPGAIDGPHRRRRGAWKRRLLLVAIGSTVWGAWQVLELLKLLRGLP